MTRVIDLFAFVLVAVLVLLPAPGINIYPAIAAERADLDHLSELEDALFRAQTQEPPKPEVERVALAVELARSYLTVGRPEWALATLHPYLREGNFHAYQVAATAYADRLQPQEALRTAEAGLTACDSAGPRCAEVTRIRLSYLAEMMRRLVAAGVDPYKDPLKARQLVREALHNTHPSARKP